MMCLLRMLIALWLDYTAASAAVELRAASEQSNSIFDPSLRSGCGLQPLM